jgi:hypothetical protein
MKNWILKIAIAFILLISFANVTASSAPVLYNAGFEDLTYLPWIPTNDSTGIIHQTFDGTSHSGIRSIRFDEISGIPGMSNSLTQIVFLQAGKTYEISAWAKSSLMKGYCNIDLYYPPLLDSPGSNKVSGLSGWTYLSETVTATDVSTAKVRLIQDGNPVGSCWFDDIAIREVGVTQPSDDAPNVTFSASPAIVTLPSDVTFNVSCSDDREDSSSTSYCKINFGSNAEIVSGDVRSTDIGDVVSSYTWNSSNFGVWGSKSITVEYIAAGTYNADARARDNGSNITI